LSTTTIDRRILSPNVPDWTGQYSTLDGKLKPK